MKNQISTLLAAIAVVALSGCGREQTVKKETVQLTTPEAAPAEKVEDAPVIVPLVLEAKFKGSWSTGHKSTPTSNAEKKVELEHRNSLVIKDSAIAFSHYCAVKVTRTSDNLVLVSDNEATAVASPFTLLAPNKIRIAETKTETKPFNPYPGTFESCPTTLTAGDYTFAIDANGITLVVDRPDTFRMPGFFVPIGIE